LLQTPHRMASSGGSIVFRVTCLHSGYFAPQAQVSKVEAATANAAAPMRRSRPRDFALR
jgi:hypothetical protein